MFQELEYDDGHVRQHHAELRAPRCRTAAVALLVVGALSVLAFYVYNWCIRQGRTGYTFGKTVVGIKLVSERTSQPIGAGLSFVRQLAHIVDGLLCYLG